MNHLGILLRCYTSNLDNLDREAGLSDEKLVYCHGNYDTAKCSKCGQYADPSKVMEGPYTSFSSSYFKLCLALKIGEPQKCEMKSDCNGWVKPNITFFGEVKYP